MLYLACPAASALSCLTATSTERSSRSGSGDPSPRNSGSPSASHRCTWGRHKYISVILHYATGLVVL